MTLTSLYPGKVLSLDLYYTSCIHLLSARSLDAMSPGRGGGTPLRDLNGDVRPDRVWFLGCFLLNGVSISSLSVLNRVSLYRL